MSDIDTNTHFSMKPFQEFYEAKDWLKASQWLDSNKNILEKSVYYYNQGIVSLKLNELPLARFYFEKAIGEGMDKPEAYKNLMSVRQDLGVETVEVNSFADVVQQKLYSLVSHDFLSLLLILSMLVVCILGVLKKIKITLYGLLGIFLLMTIVTTFFLFGSKSNGLELNNDAIVIKQIPIYEGPSAVFEQLGVLPVGLKVTVETTHNEWVKVLKPESFKGWVKLDKELLRSLK